MRILAHISKPARLALLAALSSCAPVAAQNAPAPVTTPANAPTTMPKLTSGNPLFPGDYADPEVAVFDKTYWIYPTFSARYEDQTFLDAFSSPDLVNWTKHPRIIDNNAVWWVKRAMWAPCVVEKGGKYYIFFGGNDIQDDKKDVGGIGVGVSDSPSGPFKDYLGRPLIDKIVNRAQPIDQFVFKDKDGQYLMFYGGWGRCNVVKLKADFTGLVPFEDGTIYKEVTPKGYVEGPFMFMRGGKYYFMWSEGGWTGPDYRVAYAISDSPYGPFERVATILEQDTTIATGAGHHSVLQVPGTDDWYIVYHRRPIGSNARDNRVTCIEKMVFDDKGHIQQVKMTNEGVPPQRVN